MPLKSVWLTFFTPKHCFSVLIPVSLDTAALTKSYFKFELKIVREFLRKRLFFNSQAFVATSYYGFKDPLPESIFKTSPFWKATKCQLLVVKTHLQSECLNNAKEDTTTWGKLRYVST